jgi:membrane fusion protein, multidrug efflux system
MTVHLRTYLMLFVGIFALAAPAFSDNAPTRDSARLVLTMRVHNIDRENFGPFVGSVEPRYKTDVGFQISGRIIARDVNIGDRVMAGQMLARIDAALLRLSVKSAEADVANAEAQLANAKATESRDRALISSRAIAQSALDNATATRQIDEAKLVQAQIALRRAKDQLGYAELKAPYGGVVTDIGAEVGNIVSAGQPVVTIARPDVREAVVNIPDHLIAALPKEGRFIVSLAGNPKITVPAKIRLIAPLANAVTRTREVRLTLDRPPVAFRLGSTVEVSAWRPAAPHATLPVSAILDVGGSTSVWVVDRAKHVLKRKPVVMMATDRTGANVGGLADGDIVVTAGIHSLKAGEQVKFAEDQP